MGLARPTRPGASLLRTAGGRIRVGWRLLLYLLLLASLFLASSLLVGTTLTAGSGALLAAGLVAGWSLLALDGRGPAALGMPLRWEALRHAVSGLALGTGVALAAVASMAGAGVVRWTAQAGTVSGYLGAGASTLALLALPAAAEEVVLRGYPLQAAADAWGAPVGLLGTSAVFSLLHSWNPGIGAAGLANIFVAGLFLGAVYLRTGSLWWATGAHLGWNWGIGFWADLPVSGLDVVDVPGLDARLAGPDWLSGGAFGPEGSVLATGAVLVAATWVWRTGRLRPAGWVREAPPLAPLRVVGDRGGEIVPRDELGRSEA